MARFSLNRSKRLLGLGHTQTGERNWKHVLLTLPASLIPACRQSDTVDFKLHHGPVWRTSAYLLHKQCCLSWYQEHNHTTILLIKLLTVSNTLALLVLEVMNAWSRVINVWSIYDEQVMKKLSCIISHAESSFMNVLVLMKSVLFEIREEKKKQEPPV